MMSEKELEKIFLAVAKTNDGLKLFAHLLAYCGHDSIAGFVQDPRRNDYNNGLRHVADYIAAILINADIDTYVAVLKMIYKEQKNEMEEENE